MTDSVKRAAFAEVWGRVMTPVSAVRLSHEPIGAAVENAVVLRRAEDAFDVVLRFGKRNIVDELIARKARPFGPPLRHTALAGVVGGQRRRGIAVEHLHEIDKVGRAN